MHSCVAWPRPDTCQLLRRCSAFIKVGRDRPKFGKNAHFLSRSERILPGTEFAQKMCVMGWLCRVLAGWFRATPLHPVVLRVPRQRGDEFLEASHLHMRSGAMHNSAHLMLALLRTVNAPAQTIRIGVLLVVCWLRAAVRCAA
jgi:hypothetical protein